MTVGALAGRVAYWGKLAMHASRAERRVSPLRARSADICQSAGLVGYMSELLRLLSWLSDAPDAPRSRWCYLPIY